MSEFILVRHAQPDIDSALPAADWPLSEAGRRAARELAFALEGAAPGMVVTSPERKAVETGTGIAAILDLGLTIDDDLREQGMGPLPFLDDAAFQESVASHFLEPDRVVLGSESSADAGARLERALMQLSERAFSVQGVPVIVTHGRIMASFLARLTGGDALAIWQSLRMPDAYAVDLGAKTSRRIQD